MRRRLFGAEPPTVATDRARQVRFLLQRGFSGEQVRAALGPLAARDLELDDRGGDDGNAEDV